MSDFEIQFGKNLKRLRELRKLSQEVLAERIGIGSTTISKIENGKCFVTSETLKKIILALEIQPHELFLFNIEEPNKLIYNQLLKNLESDKIKNNFAILKLLLDFTNEYLNKRS